MRRGRKASTGTTRRRRQSSARLSADFSADDSDESMYRDDSYSHGKRRRPMQTLLALKKQKRRKESRAERANHATPNETTRVGQAESLKNRNANTITKGGKGRISSRFNDDDDDDVVYDDNDDGIDDSEPITSVWEIDDNPWGVEGHLDGDVVLFAPRIDMGDCDMLLPSNRYKSDAFSENSPYRKTHQTPIEGFQLLVLTRDIMARSSWGFSCYIHEFGGACLVKHVDPLSPADTASFAGHSGSRTGTELGLKPNDMIIALNGKLTGGMGEVELQVALETAACELLLVVSRYKFARQGMDKIEEAERRLLAAVDEAMNDEHLLGWTDLGARVTTESTSRASGYARLPPASKEGSLQNALDGNGHTPSKEMEQPSNNVSKAPLGNGSDDDVDQEETLKNTKGVSDGGKCSNGNTHTRIAATTGSSPERQLPATLSSNDRTERTDDPSAHARTRPSKHTTPLDTERRPVAFEEEQKSEEEQSDENNSVDFGPLVATRTEYASVSNMQDRFNESSQEISSRGSHSSANFEEDDDGNAWCGCVCGLVHPKSIPVYWIQCGACMTWYNVSQTCVGFDCHHAQSLEHWECWACNGPDASVAGHHRVREQTDTIQTILPRDPQQQLQSKQKSSVACGEFMQMTGIGSEQKQQDSISNDRAQHDPSSGALEGCETTAVVNINTQTHGSSLYASNGKTIPPDRWTADGCILPKSKPSQRTDGRFIRGTGRGIAGFRWDENRGVYAPMKKRTSTTMDASQNKGNSGKQRGEGSRSRKSFESPVQQRRLRPVRLVAAAGATTTSSPAVQNPETGIGDENASTTSSLDDEVLNEGDHVLIKEHAWPGVNNPEGIAVVLKSYIDEDGDQLYDVKYVVGGYKKMGILVQFVRRYVF